MTMPSRTGRTVLAMRFDNWAAQHRWNRMAADKGGSRHDGKLLYGLSAAFVSLLWIPGLALSGSFGEGPASSYLTNLLDWSHFAAGFMVSGVAVAFLFRKHIREATWLLAPFTALAIGMIASIFATIPYVWAAYYAPIMFLFLWKATLPLSWFSFWAMRSVDRRLWRKHA